MDLFGTKKRRARKEMWQELGRDLGGQWFEAEGFWNPKHERIEVTLRDVPIVVDTYAVSNGKTQQVYTRVCGQFTQGPAPKVRVAKKGALHMIGKWLGMSDHELGDSPFDDLFVVKAESAAIARRLWDDEARRLMFTWFRDAKLRADRKGLELVEGGSVWDDREKIKAGVYLIAELGARDLYGRQILERVEGGTISEDKGGWPRVELDTGVRVVIRAEVLGDNLAMVARTSERGIELEPLVITDGKVEPARGAQLPPGAHVPLGNVGTATLTVDDGGMSVAWRSIEVDAASLRAGAELLGAMAIAAPSAYR